MQKGYIYKLTLKENTDSFSKGEIYIGKHNGAKPEYFCSGKLVKNLINKYSKDIFDEEIIARDIEDKALLSYLEVYYIDLYESNRNKYSKNLNLTDGGEGFSGYERSEETIEKMRQTIKKQYEEGKRTPPKQKDAHQYDIKTGSYIKTFKNCTVAAREVGCTPSSIAGACRDEYASTKGFMWSYRKMDTIDKVINGRKPVIQYDQNMNKVAEYESVTKAGSENNWNHSAINNCLTGRTKTSYGYIWKYKNEVEND